jgi:hypothetical protein
MIRRFYFSFVRSSDYPGFEVAFLDDTTVYLAHISRVWCIWRAIMCVPAEGSGEAFFGVVGLGSFLRRLGTSSSHVYFTVVEEDRGTFSVVPPLFLSQAANVGCIHRGGR